MPFSNNKEFTCSVKSTNIFDEKNNTSLSLDQVAWGKKPEEGVEDKDYRYSVVKRMTNADGTERIIKALSFLSPNGPHELSCILAKEGFGETKKILQIMADRNDCPNEVKSSIQSAYESEESSADNYVDLREFIG